MTPVKAVGVGDPESSQGSGQGVSQETIGFSQASQELPVTPASQEPPATPATLEKSQQKDKSEGKHIYNIIYSLMKNTFNNKEEDLEKIQKINSEIISISLLEEWEELNMYDSVATNAITNLLLFGPSTLKGDNEPVSESVES